MKAQGQPQAEPHDDAQEEDPSLEAMEGETDPTVDEELGAPPMQTVHDDKEVEAAKAHANADPNANADTDPNADEGKASSAQQQASDPTNSSFLNKNQGKQETAVASPPPSSSSLNQEASTTKARTRKPRQRQRSDMSSLRSVMSAKGAGGRLSTRDVNWKVPTNSGAKEHIEEAHGNESWEYRTLAILHSTTVQLFFMSLLMLDVVILFTELFLLAQYPPCAIIERDAISCCGAESTNTSSVEDHQHRWLAGDAHGESVCPMDTTVPMKQYEAGCDSHKWSTVHTVEEVLFALTITILSSFFVELHVEMIALKPQIFFRQFFFALDYFIVTVSLVLELTFHFLHEDTLQSLFGLLVVARVWRFVRIGHGIIELTHEWAHHDYTYLLSYAEELEEKCDDHGIELPEKRPTACDADGKEKPSKGLLADIEREHRLHCRTSSH